VTVFLARPPFALGAQEQVQALLDASGSSVSIEGIAASALYAAAGEILGRPAIVAAIDPGRARGAIGVDECRALSALIEHTRSANRTLVLVLESSGARMDQGLEVLAAFRRLLRAILEARRRGLRMVAIVGRACYGGASMLACLADRRIFAADSRMGMSGPGVMASLAGERELNADDPAAVEALFGGCGRSALIPGDPLCEPTAQALRQAVADALRAMGAPDETALAARHRRLLERLRARAIEIPRNPRPASAELKQRMDALFAGGFESVLGDGIVRGVRMCNGREMTVTGIVGAAPLTAIASWMLAESIITSVSARPQRPIIILYDSPGHAATRFDECVLLSEYLVHLAQTIQWAETAGVAVSIWVLGEASGGGYVTLTAACRAVIALPGADVRVLPQAAVDSVLGARPAEDRTPERWRSLGLVDWVIDGTRLPDALVRATGLPSTQ
jgi:hypothetical protein